MPKTQCFDEAMRVSLRMNILLRLLTGQKSLYLELLIAKPFNAERIKLLTVSYRGYRSCRMRDGQPMLLPLRQPHTPTLISRSNVVK